MYNYKTHSTFIMETSLTITIIKKQLVYNKWVIKATEFDLKHFADVHVPMMMMRCVCVYICYSEKSSVRCTFGL